MRSVYWAGGLCVLSIALAMPAATAEADIRPIRPGSESTLYFRFEYRVTPVALLGGELRQCNDDACSTSFHGSNRFDCGSASCFSRGADYARYQKLIIGFSDGVRESNVFEKKNFDADYVVTVHQNRLTVRLSAAAVSAMAAPPYVMPFRLALPLTILIELAVAAIYLARLKLMRGLVWVVVANLISVPVVWFGFPVFRLGSDVEVLAAEVFAVVFEALVLYAGIGRRGLSLRHAGALSLLMNAASFGTGWLGMRSFPL